MNFIGEMTVGLGQGRRFLCSVSWSFSSLIIVIVLFRPFLLVGIGFGLAFLSWGFLSKMYYDRL